MVASCSTWRRKPSPPQDEQPLRLNKDGADAPDDRPTPVVHPVAVSRLPQTRAGCSARLQCPGDLRRIRSGPPDVAGSVWVLALAFTLGSLGFWIWSLFIYDPGLLVDELADTSSPPRPRRSVPTRSAQIDLLPRAEATDDPVERADVVDSADAALASMLAELAPIAPTEPPETAEAVDEWLGDWAVHLEDRQTTQQHFAAIPTPGSPRAPRATDSSPVRSTASPR